MVRAFFEPRFFHETGAHSLALTHDGISMRNNNISAKSPQTQLATVVSTLGKNGVEQGVLARDLMTEIMGVVPILGGASVTVGFAGDSAFCDAKLSYVNVPSLPPANIIPLQIAREIRGFASHEAAHIAFTDPDIFPSKILDASGNYDPLLKETWNCCEDFMIEKHWLALYPGSRKNFAATEIRCCRSYQDMYQKDPDCAKDLRVVGPVALTWVRSLYFQLGVSVSRECFETLSPAFRNRVMGWFADLEDVETTEDCLRVARIIHADIMSDPYDPQDPPKSAQQNQQGQNQGQGSGQGNAQGAGQAGGQNGQPGAQAGNQSGGGADQSQGAATGAAGATGAGPVPKPISTSANIQQVMKDANVIDANANYVSAQILSTSAGGPYSSILSDPDGQARSDKAMKTIRGAVAATASELRKALKAAAKDRIKGGRLDGKLDRRRLAMVPTGAGDIYTRKIKGEKIDTAVQILVDCSGSMENGRIETCQQLALILEGAFANTPIKHEIIGFTTGDVGHADPAFQTMVAANKKRQTGVNARAINTYEFRSFAQSYHTAVRSIGNMCRTPMLGTPTGDAMLLAHDRLAKRQETRHVMFVLTDGAADNSQACKKAVQAIEKCGVTVVGIGIGTSSVKSTFTNHIVLNEATDLPALMMSQLSKILIGDKAKVALKGGAAIKTRSR
jgi:Mg-chelatase subunit ChlD